LDFGYWVLGIGDLQKAAEYSVSMAELVRQGVDLLVERQIQPSREELKRRAMAIGEYHDIEGATDVSINHDIYLAEIYAEIGGDDDLD